MVGKLRLAEWTRREGERRSKVQVIADTVTFLGKPEDRRRAGRRCRRTGSAPQDQLTLQSGRPLTRSAAPSIFHERARHDRHQRKSGRGGLSQCRRWSRRLQHRHHRWDPAGSGRRGRLPPARLGAPRRGPHQRRAALGCHRQPQPDANRGSHPPGVLELVRPAPAWTATAACTWSTSIPPPASWPTTTRRDEKNGALGVDFIRRNWPENSDAVFYKPHAKVWVCPPGLCPG